MEAHGVRGVWLLLILNLGTRWGVSGQHHAPAALYPRGKDPPYPLYRRLGGLQPVWTQRLEEKSSVSVGDRIPVVQSVVRHYID
jgi:hypothetical protein